MAQGVIVKQPAQFTLVAATETTKALTINVSTTKTRAVIEIDKVLAPKCIIAYHHQALEDIQNGRESFEVVVSISCLRTRSSAPPAPLQNHEPTRELGTLQLIKPPAGSELALVDTSSKRKGKQREIEPSANDTVQRDPDSNSNHESDSDSTQDIDSENENDLSEFPEYSGYHQIPSDNIPSGVLGDVFHEIDKVTKTISKKNTLHKKFARAFSDTMLVPDEGDKKGVVVVLTKKNLKWELVRSRTPSWLWQRVRRYIPERGLLHRVLNELFQSWGNAICTVTKAPLFSAETWQKAQRVLHDVDKGWISDPPHIPLYTISNYDHNQLVLYHCIRGTNSVEGAVHNPIRRNFASLNASPELADALIADFRHRHNYDTGSVHKLGKRYLGHYDPWIDHDILRLRADINWSTETPGIKLASGRILKDSDPLSFTRTDEQFGITRIPEIIHLQNDFNSRLIDPNQERQVYPSRLHLSKLVGKRKSVYDYLANAQGTRYAVTPLHTDEEFTLFHTAVKVGGNFSPLSSQPNFDLMASWWSTKANGTTIFYKLREHLANYYKTWLQTRKETESIVASRPQRKKNESRIKSAAHISHVLPAAPRDQPGVLTSDLPIVEPEIIGPVTATVITTSLISPTNNPVHKKIDQVQKLFGLSEPLETLSSFV